MTWVNYSPSFIEARWLSQVEATLFPADFYKGDPAIIEQHFIL